MISQAQVIFKILARKAQNLLPYRNACKNIYLAQYLAQDLAKECFNEKLDRRKYKVLAPRKRGNDC